MVRVQHVDTEQGPILRKYDLSSITISTAATSHYDSCILTLEKRMNFEEEFLYLQGWRKTMSKEKYTLHPISAVINFIKVLKEMIVPIVVVVAVNGFGGGGIEGWTSYIIYIIYAVLLIAMLVSGIINWKRFRYWFEEEELRIEYGLFVKKKRFIPFERIQSLNYTEGIFHRPFGLVKVTVETAGGGATKEADAELTAISKAAAEQIKKEMNLSQK